MFRALSWTLRRSLRRGLKAAERRWADQCEAYRRVVDEGPAAPAMTDVAVCDVDGLRWRLPHPDTGLSQRILQDRVLPTSFEIRDGHSLGVHGHTMIDVGANIGTSTIPRIRQGHFQHAYVVEPEALDFRCLVHNIFANSVEGQVFPDNRAIFSFTGEVKLLAEGRSGIHRIVVGERARWKGTDVSCLTLDDWIRHRQVDMRRVSFIKCDVEGAEGHVLRGAERILDLRRVIWQIEYQPHRLAALETRTEELLRMIRQWFTHFSILGKGGKKRDLRVRAVTDIDQALSALQLTPRGFTNMLLFPQRPSRSGD